MTLDGLQKIINIRASMNLGLSDLQKLEFPNYQTVERKIIQTTSIPEPQWVVGFISGEACFIVSIFKSNSHKIGLQVKLIFTVVQYEREKNLMVLLIKYLGCGKVYKKSNLPAVELRIVKLDDLKKNSNSIIWKKSNPRCETIKFQILL